MARLEAVEHLGTAALAYSGVQAEVVRSRKLTEITRVPGITAANSFGKAVEKLNSDLGSLLSGHLRIMNLLPVPRLTKR